MKVKSLLSAGLGALALVTTATQAGPYGLAGAIDRSAARSELTEKVTWYGDGYSHRYHRPYHNYRWYRDRHYGHRHGYGWYGDRYYGWYPRYGYRHW